MGTCRRAGAGTAPGMSAPRPRERGRRSSSLERPREINRRPSMRNTWRKSGMQPIERIPSYDGDGLFTDAFSRPWRFPASIQFRQGVRVFTEGTSSIRTSLLSFWRDRSRSSVFLACCVWECGALSACAVDESGFWLSRHFGRYWRIEVTRCLLQLGNALM